MNPLDLPGPQFLGFYLLYGTAGLAAAALVRRMLAAGGSGSGGGYGSGGGGFSGRWSPGSFPREEDAYAIARLRSNRVEAARAVLGFLFTAKLIAVEKTVVSRLPGAPVATDLMPIERQGLDAIGDGQSARLVERQVGAAIASRLSGLESELESAGLIWPHDRQGPFRWLRNAALVAIVGLGLAKLLVAVMRGRPNIEFLFFFILGYAIAILIILAPPVATAAGTSYLDWLQRSHAGLLSQVAHGRALQPRQVALAAAIFGLRQVPPLAPLTVVLLPQASGGADGSGGGSSCGGGGSGCGGGGGGCGGCGSS